MTYVQRIAVIPAEKVSPFIEIYKKVYAFVGNERDAAKMLNVSRNTLERLCESRYLTDKQGKVILAAYRGIKHHLPKVTV